MLNYALLDALAAVIRNGSFDRAAKELNVSQSAISQRVKLLEELVGSVLIRRGQPCMATPSGALLCQHAERVQFMEADLDTRLPSLRGGSTGKALAFRVAVNDDSMSTWFIDALADFCIERELLLDIVIDDQDHTIDLIRDGSVQAAVTTQANPVQGWRSMKLGKMRYRAVCSPGYYARFFSDGVNLESLQLAPQITFTSKDKLQTRFAAQIAGVEFDPPVHLVPHTLGYVRGCVAGLAWGMCPEHIVEDLIREGHLVEFAPGNTLEVELYWQCWRLSVDWLNDICILLSQRSGDLLNQGKKPTLTIR